MEEKKWYRADFKAVIDGEDYYPDSEYFEADNDEEAIKVAKFLAECGVDYIDIEEQVDMELTYVCLVDENNEYEEIRTIFY